MRESAASTAQIRRSNVTQSALDVTGSTLDDQDSSKSSSFHVAIDGYQNALHG